MNQTENKELYPVRCTECGEQILTKKFPLDRLLEQYHNGQEELYVVHEIIGMLGIQAEFGSAVLPKVPALFQNGKLVIPSKSSLDKEFEKKPNIFQCQDNEVPQELLIPVELNMSSLVAQFYMATGFYDIYRMLHLLSDDSGDLLNSVEEDNQTILDRLCDSFAALPNVTLSGEMTTMEDRRAVIRDNLYQILNYAKMDGTMQDQGENHAAMEELSVGWRYKLVNDRQMPFSLVVRGSNGNIYDAEDCRCPVCGRRMSHKMGAYCQKIVGLLGTQATGKTTYLAALTDAIQIGEVASLTESNGNVQLSGLTIQPCADNDPQWERVVRQPRISQKHVAEEDFFSGFDMEENSVSGGEQAGTLWLYQNGFPPEKTKVNTLDASALTFLVTPGKEKEEPVMYTLADIPGEAFFDSDHDQDEMLVKIQHKLLFSCSAIIMVISSRQLLAQSAEKAAASDKLVISPSDILAAYEKFLPDHSVPTAVVLTACDELNHGDMRKALHLAYDIRKCRPLVWSDSKGALVYNAEPMQTSIQAVWKFLNSEFGLFTENLANVLRRGSDNGTLDLAAFAVSNGTQYATRTYSEMNQTDLEDDSAQRAQRCQRMRKGRFGVSAPLLWLLARDGLLDAGCAEPEFGDNRPEIHHMMQEMLLKSLRQDG